MSLDLPTGLEPSDPQAVLPGHPIGDYVTLFRRHLVAEWRRKKKPYGLDEAWAKAHTLSEEATEKIFLDAGFQAWISYYLATNIAGYHYKGKSADLNKIESLDQLPIESRRAIATALAGLVPHATVQEAIQRLNPSKRARNRTESSSTASAVQNTSEGTAYFDNARTMSVTTRSPEPRDVPDDSRNSSDTVATPIARASALNAGLGEQRLEKAPVKGIAAVLPQYMCGAIRKSGMKASVTMTFPHEQNGGIHCFMSLSILPNKLEFVAMKLLGVHLETEGKMRYVIFPNGAKMLPRPEVSLQGAMDETIRELLGSMIASAVAGSPLRKEEIANAVLATTCVTMTISNSAHDDGILNLNLGLEGGIAVKEALFM
ncbi:hypothetical protein HIM_09048 [Hirsutella minnesotensis 3608]|uniref:Uncharacterized protein n=1 Tax=Hirsutella minnesotensis 3608 TaxID=1043627 RepID=A0A0F8A3C3_9HYPO|nr:hypothetical protein HIM_09048 [Hirsutella minnesotensis 3608]